MKYFSIQNLGVYILLLLLISATVSCGNKQEKNETTESTEPAKSMFEETAIVGDIANGKVLFDTKCVACHKASDEKLIGPGLKDVTNRRTEEWIKKMVKDPADMLVNDEEAKKLLEEYKIPMTPLGLTDNEINDVYAYLKSNDNP